MAAAVSEQVLHFGPSNQNRVIDEASGPDPWLSARFEPDFLVPVQFFDLTRRRSMLDGETRLVFAVLEDAVRCYHSPFSFEYVCDVLGIEPASLRSRLGLLSVNDLPTKQMRSVGRRQVVRAGRSSRKRSNGVDPASAARGAGLREGAGA
jgi:hypothetical protein